MLTWNLTNHFNRRKWGGGGGTGTTKAEKKRLWIRSLKCNRLNYSSVPSKWILIFFFCSCSYLSTTLFSSLVGWKTKEQGFEQNCVPNLFFMDYNRQMQIIVKHSEKRYMQANYHLTFWKILMSIVVSFSWFKWQMQMFFLVVST